MNLRTAMLHIAACVAVSLISTGATAQEGATEAVADVRPPSNIEATDRPDDVGNAIELTWTLSPDDVEGVVPRPVLQYNIYRKQADAPDVAWEKVADATYQKTAAPDPNAVWGVEYVYRLTALTPDGIESPPSGPSNVVSARMQYFVSSKAWFGIVLLIVGGAVLFYIESVKRGRDLKIRRIAGLEAVTDAVGRATEMGRPVLYIAGIQDINDIQTIAGITILGNVARVCAEYDAKLEMPTSRSLVMTTARETVENAFLAAGRPDAYNEDLIYYLTDEQFGFVAGVVGTMVREKPAACFYMGAFYAESLMLAETGNSIGAIQVAGTAMPSQLPFFVAACDYTLIGEEFFAASAYLSGEPHQLGSLKGQDVGKLIGAILIVVGCLAATLAVVFAKEPIPTLIAQEDPPLLAEVAHYIENNVLGKGGFLP